MVILSIAVLGAAGVLTRFGCTQLMLPFVSLPWATTIINVVGSLCIGMGYAVTLNRGWGWEWLRVGLLVGFLGGFTTFSTYSLESFVLIQKRAVSMAAIHLITGPILGLIAAWLGYYLLARST